MHSLLTFNRSEHFTLPWQAFDLRRGPQHIGCIYIMCLFVSQLIDVHAAKTEVGNTSMTSATIFIQDDVSSREAIRR